MEMQDLIKAIRRHSGMDYEQIVEAGEHGADAGWPGFTYTRDAARFYDRNKAAIWDLLNERADDLGEPVLQMIAQFNRSDMTGDVHQFENLLAWFALEEAGRWLADQQEHRN
ncbi:MAG: hypothetical protein HS116_19330 [Planctomycetes bacterium]|nr:hypothetical protein [Planctomycetota bacterium]